VTSTGNSFAAPHITGFVARMLEQWPHLTPFQIKTVLRSYAWNVRGGSKEVETRSPTP
jgi:hypothetical protein